MKPRRRSRRTDDDPADRPPPKPRSPQEVRDDLIAYAFRALGGRALTETELRTKLEKRSDDPALIDEILKRVQELGYQNDAHVARAEGSRRNVGTFRVRQTLKRRGVGDDLIQDTLDARDPDSEREAALELLTRRWPAFSRKRDPRATAYAFLARRGFPSGVIWSALRNVADLPDEDLESGPEEDFDPEPES